MSELPIPSPLTRASRWILGTPYERLAAWAVLLNILIWFARPQDTFPLLGHIKVTALLAGICFVLWITRAGLNLSLQAILMGIFLLVNMVLIFIGKFVWEPLILNDGRALSALRQLTVDFLFYAIPLLGFFCVGRNLRRLSIAFVLLGAYLGAFSLLHSGQGPGGFLGDENDFCLVLTMLLPFSFFALFASRSLLIKLVGALALVLVLAGIVATNSRGGFIGLLCTLAYMWWKGPHKILLSLIGLSIILGAFLFVPKSYWEEMQTIREAAEEGTGRTRIETWKLALRMWSDPRNLIQGVGLENSPWTIHQYEPTLRVVTERSLAGRAMHSIYFQLLGDMGLIGIFLVGGIVGKSLLDLRRVAWETASLRRTLSKRLSDQPEPAGLEQDLSPPVIEQAGISRRSWTFIISELRHCSILCLTLSAAWVALLSSGAFISVLYYPPLWFLAVISSSVAIYAGNLLPPIRELLASLGQEAAKTEEEFLANY